MTKEKQNDECRYSLKMRASCHEKDCNVHLSGCEYILPEQDLESQLAVLYHRAMDHSKKKPDFINMKIEAIDQRDILMLKALPVRTLEVTTAEAGRLAMRDLLAGEGIGGVDEIMSLFKEAGNKRGALLYDVKRKIRLEPDPDRGIRATFMGAEPPRFSSEKDYYREAIILATKVANTPHLIAELCISDDPDYVTGYYASLQSGYVRITKLKEMGNPIGGRIFLFKGEPEEVAETVRFLEKKPILITGIQNLPQTGTQDLSQTGNQDFPQIGTQDQPQTGTHKLSQTGTQDLSQIGIQDLSKFRKVDKWQRISSEMEQIKQRNLYRSPLTFESAQKSHVIINGQEKLLLASNNYLDLAADPRIIQTAEDVSRNFGIGSGGARLTTGTTCFHTRLEKRLAQWEKTEDALIFNTGYIANLSTIAALCEPEQVIFSDELNHASIIDGCRFSRARIVVYRHADMKDLEQKIRTNPSSGGLIVSDAVFSMDGDIVPLPELVNLAERYGLFSMIDEAHALGVLGVTGHGTCEYFGYEVQPDIIMGTMSKSLGAEGGFICGPTVLIDYLRHRARGFVFSTSLPASVMAATQRALDIIEEEPQRVLKLRKNREKFCQALNHHGLDVHSESAIVPIIIGDEEQATKIAQELFEKGFFVSAIRYPTVARGKARLRVAIMATHSFEELEEAAEAIALALK